MIQLICIDVDGTLVGTSGSVLPGVWAAAEQARAAGVRLAICSGRPAFGLARQYASRLDGDGWHVFQNGASVVSAATGQSMSKVMPPALVDMLVARARSTGHILELYTDTDYAVESDSDRARRHASLLGIPFTGRPFASVAGQVVRAQWLLAQEDTAAVLAMPHPGLELSPSTSPIMPDTIFVNTTVEGVNKATAVRAVAEEYGISLDDVMFVGDGHNDLGAMRAVGVAVAMGNAETELHEVAAHRVSHVDEGGLIEALELALGGSR
jgi:Cof subfamily protein (haloacid dehalogenase superfamily)